MNYSITLPNCQTFPLRVLISLVKWCIITFGIFDYGGDSFLMCG